MTAASRLRARRLDLEEAVLTRVHSISDPTDVSDPAYAEGLRAAVTAALDYGLDGLEGGEGVPDVPPTALFQARLAARSGVSLDTVLRRYFAGLTLFNDLLIDEAEKGEVDSEELKRLHRRLSMLFDHLLNAVSAEYQRQVQDRSVTSRQRRVKLVRSLLDGEFIDTAELGYELDCHHLALVAVGLGVQEAIRDLAVSFDRRLLLASPDQDTTWAWLGGRHPFDGDQLAEMTAFLERPLSLNLALALGEPGEGLVGWRLSHRQAGAALLVAVRGAPDVVRYRDVALSVALLQDDLLATSLRRLYLDPLARERDGGEVARQTLRAYFAAERNISSTAARLGVNRNTVSSRLRLIEESFGRPLGSCAAEVEAALRLDELCRR
jgi:PucR C-terminal helix-turn-helix domain/GGDEF-like domain